MNSFRRLRIFSVSSAVAAVLLSGAAGVLLGTCGPFTDFTDAAFCPFVLEIFYLGITTGTTPTTYDPATAVSRLQMAAFLSRTVDGVLKRGSRRTILNQNWTQRVPLNTSQIGTNVALLQSDGTDIWVAITGDNKVQRYRALN